MPELEPKHHDLLAVHLEPPDKDRRQSGIVHQPPKGFAWVLTREKTHGSPWNRWLVSYNSTTRAKWAAIS
jgi:hypothetical protein